MDSILLENLYNIFLQHPHIQTDTRKLQKGDLYFALKGDNFNGNEFAAKALQLGAAYAIVDEMESVVNEKCLFVDDVLSTLQSLASLHRNRSKAIIIGITGTNGKTTTKELMAAVLEQAFRIIYTAGNLNNHIGVPLTLLTIKEDTEIAIVEMGANHVGEIASYCKWAQPDYGIITNIGKAHLEGFGSLEGVKTAKGELYTSIAENGKMLFQYTDTPHLKEILPDNIAIMTYGATNSDICGTADGTAITLSVDITFPEDLMGHYNTQLVGAFNLPNVLCAIAVGHFFKMQPALIQKGIADYTPSNNRSQLLKSGTNTIILDAYNANPSSLHLALENLARLAQSEKWALLGAMKEMGENEREEHHNIVQKLKSLGLTNAYLVGREYMDLADGYLVFENSAALAKHLSAHPIENATILIKGSRGAKMEVLMEVFGK